MQGCRVADAVIQCTADDGGRGTGGFKGGGLGSPFRAKTAYNVGSEGEVVVGVSGFVLTHRWYTWSGLGRGLPGTPKSPSDG